ncbi:group II intron maturase-specific domain-containing protein [Mesorhizobium sp. NZP2298]|uniref:group II intron maturase-specific domain-containing protein n=1 Tax=Mesorhizobium sp. NZP2298 TaxID=2483403 RepID=UPI001FEFE1D1|nr:group II intron maturase-specific domain-containing protein [Mesorhizobium sp. NZP2298]
MREKIRDLHIRRQTLLSSNDIARLTNPLLRGWIRLLWTVCANGAAAHTSLRQSDGACVGRAEVQALWQG